jgi:3-hydroxyisobutyrate dehydrogenase
MSNIAVLGTGQMGRPIARRLLAAGHHVTVWNRTASRAAGFGTVAATPAQAVIEADVVITMLTDAAAVENALYGESGAADALRPGSCLIQMSTISPDETRSLASRLPPHVSFVDAPVGGSVGAVEAGALTIFAGGEPAAISRAEPVLQTLGTLRQCGAVGAGSALKLVANSALITAVAALRDTLLVASAYGVDRGTALDVLAAGPLGGALKRATATGASFAIALAAKDARLALTRADGALLLAAAARLLEGAADQQADLATLVTRTDNSDRQES